MPTSKSDRTSSLQLGFSEQYSRNVFDRASRLKKAQKTLAILADYLGDLSNLTALDIGCAAGNSTVGYSSAFKWVAAVDVDAPAVEYARRENQRPNIGYAIMNGQRLAFCDESFDVIVCAHVYEHVPDAHVLMDEIKRLLKPGGVCFFSAGNRLSLMEPHYRLPLLSIFPRPISHLYLRLLRRGHFYYEKHLTYWGLKELVADFQLSDYTARVVEFPERFQADDVIKPGSLLQRLSSLLLKIAYWACPTYLWVLQKPMSIKH